MTKRWFVVSVVLGVLWIGAGRAQQPSSSSSSTPAQEATSAEEAAAETADAQRAIFRSGISYIRVDAIATDDDGNPVLDLTQDEFEIDEDGVRQEIDGFQLVQVDPVPQLSDTPLPEVGVTRSDQERAAAAVDVRVFVIFLDDYHVREGNSIRASRMLIEFLENDLIPTDLVGVMYPLMPLDAVRLTRDHESVIAAIEQFRGVKYDYEPRNGYEQRYNYYPTEVVERVRNDVSLSALRGLMVYLGGLREGRKTVLVVSEGYSSYVPPQLRSQNATMLADPRVNPARLDPFAAENSFEDTYAFFQGTDIMMDLRRVFQTANRFNTSLYTVDPRGLAAFEFDVDQPNISFRTDQSQLQRTQDTLRVLAEETDGRAIVNQNDLRPGLQQMLSDSSSYYLLGYESTAEATDGEFHEIDVRITRPGVRVRARPGYWAITERDVERSMQARVNEPPRAVDMALGALAEPRRGRLVRTWVGTAPAEDGKTRVTFVWEPVVERGRRDTASRVLVTAMGDDGSAYFRGRVPEAPQAGRRASGSRAAAGSAPAGPTQVEFVVDPGVLHVNLAIEGEGGAVLDRDRDEMAIPDFTGPDVVFSTPAFVRARNALEFREISEDWSQTPTASRSFRRTDLLMLRFEARGPGGVTPEVEAQLLNRGGDVMFPLTVRPAADGQPFQVELAPSFLPPGEYLIELRASTPESEATELVAFRLGA